jgi:hypothetical protein
MKQNKKKVLCVLGIIISLVLIFFLAKFLLSLKISFEFTLIAILSTLIILIPLIIFFTYNFFKTKDFNEYKKNLEIIFGIIAIIISFLTLMVFTTQTEVLSKQTEIQATQTQILKQTSQSNFPDLYLISSQGYISYPVDEFTNTSQVKQLGIGITNTGKSIAPYSAIWIKSTEISPTSNWIVNNLKSFDYNMTWFYFWGEKNASIGKRDIAFEINSPFSETPIKLQNITVCIYSSRNKIIQECGEENWI